MRPAPVSGPCALPETSDGSGRQGGELAGRAVRLHPMTGRPSPSGRTWRYHFKRRGGDEVETGEFTGDEPAVARARELSTSRGEPIVVERYGLVDWHYVDEVDERP